MDSDLVKRAMDGETAALLELFMARRERLRAMICLRMDIRLRGRIDPSDVLQEAFIEIHKRAGEYSASRTVPPYVWLREITLQRIKDIYRTHVRAEKRDIRRERGLHRVDWTRDTSAQLAKEFVANCRSPSEQFALQDAQRIVRDTIDALDPMDREVLALRHYEELSNTDTAAILGLKPAAASNRYVRALTRLKDALATIPGFLEP